MNERGEESESGFTLTELLVVIVIMGVITAPLVISLITTLRVTDRTEEKFTDSRSALVAANYFANDVASANAVNPLSTVAPCGGSSGTKRPIVTFSRVNAATVTTYDVINPLAASDKISYVVDTATVGKKRLLRRACIGGGSVNQSVAAVNLGPDPVMTCQPDCASARQVKLAITQAINKATTFDETPVAYKFDLIGNRRTR